MKISIITINYNNGEGLERTIQSVINQDNSLSIEHLVIDGRLSTNTKPTSPTNAPKKTAAYIMP